MNIICIIPARGGSKGIPEKNLKQIGGLTLVARSILAAKKSNFPMRIVVSTDSRKIADEAVSYGAEVCMRPSELSGDKSTSEEALIHTLKTVFGTEEEPPELLIFLQCTSPLTQGRDIDKTIQKLLDSGADSALTVTPSHSFLWAKGENGWNGINHDKNVRPMRQDRVAEFTETGAVYVMKLKGFLEAGHRFFGKTVCVEVPLIRSLEVDDPEDLEIVRRIAKVSLAPELPFVPDAVVFDFDGVFTDNKVYLDEEGVETVRCDRGDGMGIERIRSLNIPMLILSKERNCVVGARAAKLNLEVIQGIDDKVAVLKKWADSKDIDLARCCYLGNDLNDLEPMALVGIPVAVADSYSAVCSAAQIVLKTRGGHGAVRELCEMIISLEKNATV